MALDKRTGASVNLASQWLAKSCLRVTLGFHGYVAAVSNVAGALKSSIFSLLVEGNEFHVLCGAEHAGGPRSSCPCALVSLYDLISRRYPCRSTFQFLKDFRLARRS